MEDNFVGFVVHVRVVIYHTHFLPMPYLSRFAGRLPRSGKII